MNAENHVQIFQETEQNHLLEHHNSRYWSDHLSNSRYSRKKQQQNQQKGITTATIAKLQNYSKTTAKQLFIVITKQQQIKKTIAKLREVINIHENLQKLIPKRGGVKGSLGFLKAEQWQNRRRQQENKSKTAADFGFLSNSRKTFRNVTKEMVQNQKVSFIGLLYFVLGMPKKNAKKL